MKKIVATVALFVFSAAVSGAFAAERAPNGDKYQITAEEQTACGSDAVMLCSGAYPDEDKLLACMKTNRPRLSVACRPIFDDGMRRRHLN